MCEGVEIVQFLSSFLLTIGQHIAMDIKPECIVSSEYDPIKSEETDDEDMYKDTNTSNSHNHLLPTNIKEEGNVMLKAEDDEASTDDEYSPESLVSWLMGYDPVKSEETDKKELGEDTNTSNEYHLPIKVKSEVKTTEDESTDDEYVNETEKPVRRRKTTRLLANSTTKPRAIQESIDIQRCTKKKRKRKREVGESNESIKKTAYIECSVEGCNRKAADSGTCSRKHKGYKYCSYEGCTNKTQKGGVCIRHGAKVKKRKLANMKDAQIKLR